MIRVLVCALITLVVFLISGVATALLVDFIQNTIGVTIGGDCAAILEFIGYVGSLALAAITGFYVHEAWTSVTITRKDTPHGRTSSNISRRR